MGSVLKIQKLHASVGDVGKHGRTTQPGILSTKLFHIPDVLLSGPQPHLHRAHHKECPSPLRTYSYTIRYDIGIVNESKRLFLQEILKKLCTVVLLVNVVTVKHHGVREPTQRFKQVVWAGYMCKP